MPDLEVLHKKHKQGALVPSGLSHSNKDPASSLSAYDTRCVLALAVETRPPAGPEGGLGISAGAAAAAHRSSRHCLPPFIFRHPTPHVLKWGRAPCSVPGSRRLSDRLYFWDSVLARHSVWGSIRLAGILQGSSLDQLLDLKGKTDVTHQPY